MRGTARGVVQGGSSVSDPPVNTIAPVLSGTATEGQTLSCTTGTWSNNPTSFTYQWKRGGAAIPGATNPTYVLQAADVGTIVKCTVTASNVHGSTAADSNSTAAVAAAAPPVNTVLPAITGIQTNAQTLSCSTGTWTNSPTGYTYQWKRAGVDIGSATNPTYVLQGADVGTVITCAVTASNSAGSATATSAGTGAISAVLSISGTPPPTGNVGSAYSFTPSAAGGHTAYSFALTGTLPAGLAFSTVTGAITGTPTTIEVRNGLNITVTDADGLTAALGTFSITINAASTAGQPIGLLLALTKAS